MNMTGRSCAYRIVFADGGGGEQHDSHHERTGCGRLPFRHRRHSPFGPSLFHVSAVPESVNYRGREGMTHGQQCPCCAGTDVAHTMDQPCYFDMLHDDGDDTCGNCGGEGYVAHCFEEWACVDPDSGCDLCMERCDWCNPPRAASVDRSPEGGDANAAPSSDESAVPRQAADAQKERP
jgi:hypothetical protein